MLCDPSLPGYIAKVMSSFHLGGDSGRRGTLCVYLLTHIALLYRQMAAFHEPHRHDRTASPSLTPNSLIQSHSFRHRLPG